MDAPITLLPAKGRHISFVMSSWARSNRRSDVGKLVPVSDYWDVVNPIIKRTLTESKTIVATDPEDSDHLYGFICYRPPEDGLDPILLHYVLVKQFARQRGIARRLLRAAGITKSSRATFTHKTDSAHRYLRDYRSDKTPYNILKGLGL